MSDPSDSPSPTRQIQWSRVLIEGVVIVASILLAFGIEAWWSSAQEQESLRLELGAVREEMRSNHEHLSEWLVVHHQVVAGGRLILDAASAAHGSSPILIADSAIVGAGLVPTINPSSGALNLLISSGRLALVESLELRLALSGWSSVVEDTGEGERAGYTFMVEQMLPIMRALWSIEMNARYAELNALFWENRSGGAAMPDTESSVPVTDEYLIAVASKAGISRNVVRELEALIDRVDLIVQLLDAELD